MPKRNRTGALAACLLALSSLTLTAPAQAAAPIEYNVASQTSAQCNGVHVLSGPGGNYYADGCISPSNSDIFISDLRADGYSVAVHWRYADLSRRGLCRSTLGNNVRGRCGKIFTGNNVQYRVGRCDGSSNDCTKPGNYVNWSSWASVTPYG